MRPVTVIIPTCSPALADEAVASIRRTHRNARQLRIIVVADGDDLWLRDRDVHIVPGAQPFCFARNVNIGIRAAPPGTHLCLMNDDVVCDTPDALERLCQALEEYTFLGIAAPVYSRRERNPRQRRGHLAHDGSVYVETAGCVTFAAAMLSGNVVERVGYLDERFTGYGYEDNDYCLRVRRAGLELGIVPSVMMGHGNPWGGASTTFARRPDMDALMAHNRRAFIRKWAGELFGLADSQCEEWADFCEFNFLK